MTLPMNFVTPSVSLHSSLFLDPHPAFGLVPLKEGTVKHSAFLACFTC